MEEILIKKSSLRENLLNDIGDFLGKEGFHVDDLSKNGILLLINQISDYYEEGKRLYPEVIVTNDLDIFKTFPHRIQAIQKAPLSISSFKKAIKLCAPLSVDGWVIYIEIAKDQLNFGVFSTEITESSLSLYRQTLSADAFPEDTTFAYIRSLGQKKVELRGLKGCIHIALSLDDEKDLSNNELEKLSQIIASDCEENRRDRIAMYFEKNIDEALKNGHGNLIGVVSDDPEAMKDVKSKLDDGIYLDKKMDFEEMLRRTEEEKSIESSVNLKAYTSLMINMINHDGITLLTSKGKLLGYHLFIKDNRKDPDQVGGARSRAFEAMKELGLKACFYKSQDGNIKLYENS